MKLRTLAPFLASLLCLSLAPSLVAQVPQLIAYQGRVAVGGVNFHGAGQFKFALVNSAGTATLWSNDGTSSGGSEPTLAVAIAVNHGKFTALLGDTSLAFMTPLPASVFAGSSDVRLRIWFNDGFLGWQKLTPDQQIPAVAYAQVAAKAKEFEGVLFGELSGFQNATVVTFVGGQTAEAVASGTALANASASANVPGALVKRDQNRDFAAGSVSLTGAVTLQGDSLITIGGAPALRRFGMYNLFIGDSGNFAMTGVENTGVGVWALHSNTSGRGNTATGRFALRSNTEGSSNTGIGNDTLYSNATGSDNTANGGSALSSNTTGNRHTAIGASALYANTTSGNNTAIGLAALGSNTTGNENTAIGNASLFRNTTGSKNTANGGDALGNNTIGDGNTAGGWFSLNGNGISSLNTAIGYSALALNNTGSGNTAIGLSALVFIQGTNNIALGYRAGAGLGSVDNNIAIGHAVGIDGVNNAIHIGTSFLHTGTHLSGDVLGGSFNATSDRNAKEDFSQIHRADILDRVAALPISIWRFRQQPKTRHIGPMAQDFYAEFGVGADERHIATVDSDGVALAAIQELYQKVQAENRSLTAENQKLVATLQALVDRLARLERSLSGRAH